MKSLITLLAMTVVLMGQPVSTTAVTLTAPPPPKVTSVSTSRVGGNAGSGTYYYWVVANYIGGRAQPSPATVARNVPNELSASVYIKINWDTVPLATSYDVLRTNTPNLPNGDCSCAIVVATTAATVNDEGAGLLSYTITNQGGATTTCKIDNLTVSPPEVTCGPIDWGGGGAGTVTSVSAGPLNLVTVDNTDPAAPIVDGNDALIQTKTGTNVITAYEDIGGGQLEIPNSTTLPGSCNPGEVYQDTSAASGSQMYACEGGTFVAQGGTATGGLQAFMYSNNSIVWGNFCYNGVRYGDGWTNVNGSFVNTADAATVGYPCAGRLEVTTAGDTARIYMGDNADKILTVGEDVTLYYVFKGNGTINKDFHFGWNQGTIFPGSDGCYVYKLAADATYSLRCRTASAYGAATVITGSTVDTNWHVIMIRKSGTTVYASFDGGSEFSTTASVPSSTTGGSPMVAQVNTSGGPSTGYIYLAKFAMKGGI